MKRHGRKRDDNEKPIVARALEVGASVTRQGNDGDPDLMVGFHGETHHWEVKKELGPRGGRHNNGVGELTESQARWWATWEGRPAEIVRSPADVDRILRIVEVEIVTTAPEGHDLSSVKTGDGEVDEDAEKNSLRECSATSTVVADDTRKKRKRAR